MRYLFIILSVICLHYTSAAQFDDRFYFPSKQWEPMDNVVYEEVGIRTDTAVLDGIMLNPIGTPVATILYFHGAGGNVTSYVPLIKPFVDSGFKVFMIDMQGYGKSTGKPTHLDIAHDAQVVFDTLLHRKDVAGRKIIVMGGSMGTQIATKIAKDNQDKVSALVLEGTISSFSDIAAESAPKEQRDVIRKFVTAPYAAKEDIKGITQMPKLIIHSTDDAAVPFEEGQLVYDNARLPKDFWVIKGEHLAAITFYRDEYIRRVKALVK